MADTPYTGAFFAFHEQRSRTSAHEAIPHVLEFVQPTSLVDVGCGIGTWLTEFESAGIADVFGVDGDYVERAKLLIDPAWFQPRDLARPFELDRGFDLAMSLEVAEHLPPESAEGFVASLTRLAPVVLFSAAIPHDSGDGHVNEQFPEYWQEKFLAHNYVVVDCLRRRLWNNDKVAAYYRQDMMFFVDRGHLPNYPRLAAEFAQAGERPPLSFVHPETYLTQHDTMTKKIRDSLCIAMRYAARLRAINLVVFPVWNQPLEIVRSQLTTLLQAIVAHPDRQRIALVVNVGGPQETVAGGMLSQLVAQFVQTGERMSDEMPEISAIGRSFGPDQWEVLMACVQWRVALPQDDQAAIAIAKAQPFPVLSTAAIAARQPLASP